MTAVLMNFCRALLLVLVLVAPRAFAHKASDAYLQLDAKGESSTLRVDVALRDLDVALDLDADGDGRLTWGEIKAAWPSVETYLRSNVAVQGCEWSEASRALERRADGVYAALTLKGRCADGSAPAIRYTVLREIDPTHRGLAYVMAAGGAPRLMVLDPSKPAQWAEPLQPAVSSATDASPAPSSRRTPGSMDADHGATMDPGARRGEGIASPVEFIREGITHIVTGYDHVLFLICLMLPAVMRRGPQGWMPVERLSQALLPVLGIVTAFTVAHSITLGLAAMKWVSLPPSFIEPAIAVTIVLAAIDNLRPIFANRRALVTFLFGLIHGFGFANVLAELNLPPADFAWALLQFNVGIELGQLAIVAVVVALLFLLRQRRRYPRWVISGGSCAAIVVGVLWFIERTANVSLLPM
ncbi:HupE/UreJ family protein [Piscinibacter terrae]|nr:HupE/UreJ family protein [Albitalea terrae]